MPLANRIKISEQAALIAKRLTDWANPKGGRVAVAANQAHLWEMTRDLQSDGEPLLVVICAGATLRFPELPDSQREDRNWQVVMIKGRGFYTNPMQIAPPGAGAPLDAFTDSIEAIRDLVRTMLSISDEEEVPSVRYTGWTPLLSVMGGTMADVFADGVVINFRTANDIPEVYLTEANMPE